ncbi:VirB4 family type IV secretion system protein [Vibrio algicola]|uniref:VirB4 family type IV secretion system protein n=1 Tax=Vibrio algicola TaxID=2662262 RepID=UPI0015B5FB2C|nr:type IV secretion system protein B4 [Vibrio algicola]
MTQLNESIYSYGITGEQLLTDTGAVIGVLSLDGVEPTILSEIDRVNITALIRNIIQRLPVSITLTQYYIHHDNYKIKFQETDNPRVNLALKRRQWFLNQTRDLNKSYLYWAVEVPKQIQGHWSKDLIRRLFNAVFDSDSKETLKTELSNRGSVLVEYEELKRQLHEVRQILADIQLRLSFLSTDNNVLSPAQLFGLSKSLVQLNPHYLHHAGAPISERWDAILGSGNVSTVLIDGVHFLKIDGDKPRYARFATVTGIGEQFMPEAAFCSSLPPPVNEKGNYLYMIRYKPYSRSERNRMFKSKEQELYRNQMKVTDFVSGNSSSSQIAQRMHNDPKTQQLLSEIHNAQNVADKFGQFHAVIVIFDEDINKLNQQVSRLSRVLEEAQFHLIWETLGLLEAYQSIQLGYSRDTIRQSEINSTQAAAASLLYRGSEGIPVWEHGFKPAESIYVLESDDGVPFHYTPFVGDKCLVIGVGPTRSGKTFLKNCIATHFQKLGGMYCALDVDQGSEPIARYFGDDGAIFRLEDTSTTRGFNPFSIGIDEHDDAFKTHMLNIINLMLKTNDSDELKTLTANEQLEIDRAIEQTLALDTGKLRNFSGMLAHCGTAVNQKLQRFKRGNIYGQLFDNDIDAIGVLDKPVSVYNTQGVKDNPKIAALVNTEIFFRSTRLFENPEYRERAKFLEVDECQYVLSVPNAADFLIAKARTWFKHGGGMGFWTQSPKHYSALPEWGTLRSAATTFIFMSDPEMQPEEYIAAFPFLTPDECKKISELIPKRQAYIKQMDVGIAKIVNLHVEAEQYVIATSNPSESSVANRIYQQEKNIDIAIDTILTELGMEKTIDRSN